MAAEWERSEATNVKSVNRKTKEGSIAKERTVGSEGLSRNVLVQKKALP